MQQGMLSKEMAEKLGVNHTYYSNVETGKIDPSYSFCEKLRYSKDYMKTFGYYSKRQNNRRLYTYGKYLSCN